MESRKRVLKMPGAAKVECALSLWRLKSRAASDSACWRRMRAEEGV